MALFRRQNPVQEKHLPLLNPAFLLMEILVLQNLSFFSLDQMVAYASFLKPIQPACVPIKQASFIICYLFVHPCCSRSTHYENQACKSSIFSPNRIFAHRFGLKISYPLYLLVFLCFSIAFFPPPIWHKLF